MRSRCVGVTQVVDSDGQRGLFSRGLTFTGVLGLMLAAGVVTAAQHEPLRHETVGTRARADFDANGMHARGFLILPSIEASVTYDDNVFVTDNNEQDDFITSIRPQVDVRSQWSVHELNLSAGADVRRHANESDENAEDFFVSLDGRVDVKRNTNMFGGASYRQLHESRGDPTGLAFSVEPVEYELLEGNVGIFHKFNRLSVRIEGDVADYKYDNATSKADGSTVIQDTRDRFQRRLTARAAYEIVPEYNAFIQGSINDRDYDRLQGASAFNRDSDGYEVVVGTEIDLTGIVFGEIFLGYREQEYDDPRFSNVSGMSAGGLVNWNLTGLTTVTAFLSRSIEETSIGGASGFFATTGGLNVDHELLRNVLLNANFSYTTNDYEEITREDDILNLGLGGTYLFNRYAQASLRYGYTRRDSNVTGGDYDNNRVGVNVRVQF